MPGEFNQDNAPTEQCEHYFFSFAFFVELYFSVIVFVIRTHEPGGYWGKGAISLVATWLGRSERPFWNFFLRRRCFSRMSNAACIPADTAVLIQ